MFSIPLICAFCFNRKEVTFHGLLSNGYILLVVNHQDGTNIIVFFWQSLSSGKLKVVFG